MCFSAAASFAGGAVLTSIGIASVVTNKEPSHRLFAAIPFIFGLQQISEGFVWVALRSPGNDSMLKISSMIFMIAALVIWPTAVPLSMLLMERQKTRRRLLSVILGFGLLLSLCHALALMLFQSDAQAVRFHILYTLDAPVSLGWLSMTIYLAATLLPMFFSSVKKMIFFGIVIVISYAVAQFFFQEHLVSVWCFFAALASAVIFWIVKTQRSAWKEPLSQTASNLP